MSENKWIGLERSEYTLVNLGRPARFLIPIKKLKLAVDNQTIENRLHQFLVKNFTAYTSSTIPSFGVYRDQEKQTVADESREYKVSFDGKDRIPTLIRKLAEIAKLVGEECIYLEAGQYACLIYPNMDTANGS